MGINNPDVFFLHGVFFEMLDIISVNENTIHTGRNAHKMGLLQSSILPHVCAGEAGMIGSVNSSSWNRVILHKKSEDGQGRWRSSLY